jgi:hypothetical protein
MRTDGRRPLLLTEFGGYSYSVAGHRFNLDEEYGYQKYKTGWELQNALSKLYRRDILPQIRRGLCGTILTQLSDVEDETNGLVTYDRQLVKVEEESMRSIANEIKMLNAEC